MAVSWNRPEVVIPTEAGPEAAERTSEIYTEKEGGRPLGRRAPAQRKVLAPSLADLVFMMLATLIPVALHRRMMHADGDPARHIRMGEHMIETRAMVTEDVFSHTAFGEPFLSYEWLSQITFGVAHHVGGIAAVTILTGLVIALAFALLVVFLQRRGVDPVFAVIITIAAAILASGHWAARPHIFTFLGTVLLLLLLDGRRYRNLIGFGALFALWANFHPGFFFGLGLIGVILIGDLAEIRWSGNPNEWSQRARYHAWALGVAGAATLANPLGWDLHLHILAHLNDSFLLGFTNEFNSPDFHGFYGKIFLALMLAAFAAAALRPRRLPLPTLFVLLATVALALNARRNMALFALTAVPLVAASMEDVWRGLRVRALAGFQKILDEGDARSRKGWWSAATAALLLVLAANSGRVAGQELVPDRFQPETFPVDAVERARGAGLTGTMFNHFVWGGYLVYAWREQRIFIDGMTDHFGAELAREYGRIASLAPGWRELLEQRGIDLVLVPADARLAYELARDSDWTAWHRDALAVLFVRSARQLDSPSNVEVRSP